MDQGTIEGIGTILAMAAFLGVCWWAFSKHKKKDFEEASRLPFDDEELENYDDKKASKNPNKRQK
jgi:cytochrome c oxidase cbb3-type subunit 4